MLRLAIQQLKSSFAIIPERSNRFFNLSIQTNLESPISQILQQQHKKHIEASQSTGALLLAYQVKGKDKQNVKYRYLFQSPNEVEAYSFAKSSPFKGYVTNILIQQIEMQRRIRDKQLAPKYLRE